MTHDTPPKRIWANCDTPDATHKSGRWHEAPYGTEYTLATEAEAMVAAALREAADLVADDHVSEAILDLADNHASAALDRQIAQAVKARTQQLRGTLEYLRTQARNGTLSAQVVIQNVDFALSDEALIPQPASAGLDKLIAEAVRAETERCAQIGYRICAETRHVTLGQQVENAIRAAKGDPA